MTKFHFVLLLALCTPTTLAAQDQIESNSWNELAKFYKGLNVAAYAATGELKYGVHSEGKFELGYYYEIDISGAVNFHVCPPGSVMQIDVTKIDPAPGLDCDSMPGSPQPPLSKYVSVKWKFDAEKKGFMVGWDTQQSSDVLIPCGAAPSGIIDAAKFAQTHKIGVVDGSDENFTKGVASTLNLKMLAAVASDRPTEEDCREADSFWTFPLGESVMNDSRETLAVTAVKPFSADKK